MKAICATDLSAASEAAIESETCLHSLKEIGIEEMHLVTVVPSNVTTGMPGIDHEDRRRKALARYRLILEDAGFDVESHVVRGTPYRRINGIADAVSADLTIAGSRGQSPLENRVIGSTVRNLARTTVTPLFVNRIERGTSEPDVLRADIFDRVLYATDFSENAEHAFDAFSYLRHATEETTLVHVRTPKDPEPGNGADPYERLTELTDELERWDIDTEIDIRDGDPTTEILESEAEHEPTTILIGSRGHSRLRRLLLGSVSEDIVANATGNVLLIPPSRVA